MSRIYSSRARPSLPGLEGLYLIENADGVSARVNDLTQLERFELSQIDGLHDSPERRESRQPKANQHGTERGLQRLNERIVALTGTTAAGTFKKLRAMQRQLESLGINPSERFLPKPWRLRVRTPGEIAKAALNGTLLTNWVENPVFDGASVAGNTIPGWNVNGVTVSSFGEDLRHASHPFVVISAAFTGAQTLELSGEKEIIPSHPGPWTFSVFATTTTVPAGVTIYFDLIGYDAAGNQVSIARSSSTGSEVGVKSATLSSTDMVGVASLRYRVRFVKSTSGAATAVTYLLTAQAGPTATPVEYIGPGEVGCTTRRIDDRTVHLGHKPHNYCTFPNGDHNQPPARRSNALVKSVPYNGYTLDESPGASVLDLEGLLSGSVSTENKPSLALQPVSAGTMSITSDPFIITPGVPCSISGRFLSAGLVRTVSVNLSFYTGDGVSLAESVVLTSGLEVAGVQRELYAEKTPPSNAVFARGTWTVAGAATGETHHLSGLRLSIGPHSGPLDGDMDGCGWDGRAVRETVYALNPNPFSSGAAVLEDDTGYPFTSALGSSVNPSSTARKILYFTDRLYRDVQVLWQVTTGAAISGDRYVVLRREQIGRYLIAGIKSDGLHISKVNNDSITPLAAVAFTPSTDTQYSLLVRVENDVIKAELYTSDPFSGASPVYSVGYELTADEADMYQYGEIGLRMTPNDFSEIYGPLTVTPDVYRDTAPPHHGRSSELWTPDYLVEQVDIDVKQAEAQSNSERRRPFLLTCRAKDPVIYRDQVDRIVVAPPVSPVLTKQIAPGGYAFTPAMADIGTTNYVNDGISTTPVPATGSISAAKNVPDATRPAINSSYGQIHFCLLPLRARGGLTGQPPEVGVVFKYLAGSNYFLEARVNSTGVSLHRFSAGTYTQLATWTISPQIMYSGQFTYMRCFVDQANVVRIRFYFNDQPDNSTTPDIECTYALAGTDLSSHGYVIPSNTGWSFIARDPSTHQPIIYDWEEGDFLVQSDVPEWFCVDGDIDTQPSFEIVGPVSNPAIHIPESNIHVYTDLDIAADHSAFIDLDGIALDPSFASNASLLSGTVLSGLVPGAQRVMFSGSNMDASKTRLKLTWRAAYQ